MLYFLRSKLQVAFKPTQAGILALARFPKFCFTTVRRGEDLATFEGIFYLVTDVKV